MSRQRENAVWEPDNELHDRESLTLTDDGGNGNADGNSTAQSQNTAAAAPTPPRRGWRCILLLSMAAVFIVSAIMGSYRQAFADRAAATAAMSRHPASTGTADNATSPTANVDSAKEKKMNRKSRVHPRVTCFGGSRAKASRCQSLVGSFVRADAKHALDSIPRRPTKTGVASISGDVIDVFAAETKKCKLADPSYQAAPAAPATCNDVHALGFRFGPRKGTGKGDVYPSRHEVHYLTAGGFRSVWTVTELYPAPGEEKEVVMKTNQIRRGWSANYLDQNRRDILVSERAGGPPSRSNVLPVYQYCAFSSVVPFATAGVLDGYVRGRLRDGEPLRADEQFDLALQAARGLRQAHLYRDGRATHAHADVKPPQFLLFESPPEGTAHVRLQINDFNRGQFLTRSADNETCPFRMCNVHHKGSLYRSPEEYMKCADQSDLIDVFALGGVFYYLLSDGEKPWYYVRSYDEGVERWLNGEKPRLPKTKKYQGYGERVFSIVQTRSKHPAFLAVKEVMVKCWALKPEHRPSSLQVVQMLEDKWRRMNTTGPYDPGL